MEIENKLEIIPDIMPDIDADKLMGILDSIIDYKEFIMSYECAIKEIRTKFDVLDTEFKIRYKRNPISSIQSRLKNNVSIFNKLKQKNIEPTLENIENHLSDIAGVRVICYYIDDIYKILNALSRQNDIEILKIKDYIKNPKQNGYRSVHLILSVPVFFAESTKNVKVEVQIRTIAMDFWASLEHQMKYKANDIKNADKIVYELQQCAEMIFCTDQKMQDIRLNIENNIEELTKREAVMEKLKKISN